MDVRKINEYYTEIGMQLIQEDPSLEHLAESQVGIVYLSSEQEKKQNGKAVFGQCEKVPEKYKWAIPCDFTITIFEPNVERFTEEQLRILLLHELLHVGVRMDGNEEQYYVLPHDIEDFRLVVDRYGLDWSER